MNRILLLFLVIGAIACKKEPEKPTAFSYPFDGVATALKNGIPWSAKATAGYFVDKPNTYIIRIATFDANGFAAEYLAFGPIPFRSSLEDTLRAISPTTVHIDSPLFQTNYVRYFGSDVSSGSWNPDFSSPHRISVKYDSVSEQVTGTFEIGFDIGVDTTYSTWGKPVHFSNGTFTGFVHHYEVPDE